MCPASPERTVYFVPVAPPIGRQLSPTLSQRSHLYVYEVGEFVHTPLVVVSVCATAAFPLTTGGLVRAGVGPGTQKIVYTFALLMTGPPHQYSGLLSPTYGE